MFLSLQLHAKIQIWCCCRPGIFPVHVLWGWAWDALLSHAGLPSMGPRHGSHRDIGAVGSKIVYGLSDFTGALLIADSVHHCPTV